MGAAKWQKDLCVSLSFFVKGKNKTIIKKQNKTLPFLEFSNPISDKNKQGCHD
jgi:hypothetical protein